jgi:hypothetical protein
MGGGGWLSRSGLLGLLRPLLLVSGIMMFRSNLKIFAPFAPFAVKLFPFLFFVFLCLFVSSW